MSKFSQRSFEDVLAEVQRQHPEESFEQQESRANYRMKWHRDTPAPPPIAAPPIFCQHKRQWWVIAWGVAILLLLAAIAVKAAPPEDYQIRAVRAAMGFADPPQSGIIIQVANGGTILATRPAGLLQFNCSTNMSCTFSGTTFTLTASSTASTAFSALTASANSNLGTFSASGNTWDFSGVTLFKLRVGASATTSANGDVAFDSTAGRWHIWQVSDRLLIPSTNIGTSGQVPLSNADGTATFGDPVVSQPTASLLNATVVQATGSNLHVVVDTAPTTAITAASLPLPTGASTETTLAALNTKVNTEITADYDTGAGVQTMTMRGIALPASGGAVAGGTATNPVQVSLANTGANATAVKVDGSAVTQPVSGTVTANAGTGTMAVSAASLPLPAGASTAAKQPALGTAGTPSTDVITVQGAASMTKLLVTPDSVALPANQSVNVSQINAATPLMGNGVTGTGSPRVTVASDNTPFPTKRSDGTNTAVVDPCQDAALTRTSFTISQTASAQIIAGTASKQTYLCNMFYVTATAQNVALVEGTGTVCATGIAGMMGGATAATGQNWAANQGFVQNATGYWFAKTATAADNVCLLQSGTGQISGVGSYVQK